MKKKRIVHFISSLHRGGAETVLYLLLQHTKEHYDHHVLYIHDGPLRLSLQELGIPVYRVKGLIKNYDPWFIVRLIRLLWQLNPDVIHSSLWAANFFGRCCAKLLRIPIICSVHAVAEHEGFVRNMGDQWLPIKPTYFIAVSSTIAIALREKLNIPCDNIRTIPNGVAIPLKKERICKEIFTFGAVGRFVPVKNFDLLLQAFAQVHKYYRQTQLILIGGGKLEALLRAMAEDLGISSAVKFIINEPALPWYEHFDCFVQPSAYEGMSMALLEAMAHGVPVIVAGRSGIHDIITHDQEGIIIGPNDRHALKAAMLMVQTSDRRHIWSNTARELINNNYSVARMVNNYCSFFDMVY